MEADKIDMRIRVSNLLMRSVLHRCCTVGFQAAFEQQFGEPEGILTSIDPALSPGTEPAMANNERLDLVENQIIDMRLAVSALLEAINHHQANHETTQRNFGIIVTELRDIRIDMRDIVSEIRDMQSDIRIMQSDIRTMQSEIRGLQTENHRILEFLEGRFREE
jgi:chromosome segregation ATPase